MKVKENTGRGEEEDRKRIRRRQEEVRNGQEEDMKRREKEP